VQWTASPASNGGITVREAVAAAAVGSWVGHGVVSWGRDYGRTPRQRVIGCRGGCEDTGCTAAELREPSKVEWAHGTVRGPGVQLGPMGEEMQMQMQMPCALDSLTLATVFTSTFTSTFTYIKALFANMGKCICEEH
ncbi:hypothetical protein Vafri_10732, partial [Volvox africanus]